MPGASRGRRAHLRWRACAVELGGGLATNLYAAARFNKELGEIDEVQPEQTYIDAVIAENAGR